MPHLFSRTLSLLALTLVGLALYALPRAGQAAPEPSASDSTPSPSPTLPAPQGLTFIDQGGRDRRLQGYRTPDGFTLEIVAEHPTVVNPVGLTFADDGSPLVIEWTPSPGDPGREVAETFQYKDGTTRQILTLRKKTKDRVKALTSSKKDGVFDKAKILLEDELPSSILLHDGWLYLSGRGTVRRLGQSRRDGPYDKKEVVAQGFCGFGRQQVSGMTLGPDGWLYLTAGDNDNEVEGSDGSRATVLRSGAVFRCKPDGSRMHPYAIGFCNPYRDVAFDLGGNLFHVDSGVAGQGSFSGCRLMHAPEGADFGWRLAAGARCCKPDLVRAASDERPGKMPAMLPTGPGTPAGLLIYNDTRFPEEYRGLLFYPDASRRLIRAYKVEQVGASFKVVEEFPFLTADKDDRFRPCQMVLGPDGAVYIVDRRTDSRSTNTLGGEDGHGRIYRMSWSGTKDKPALPLRGMDSWMKIARLTDDDLLKTLSSDEASDRERARRELVKRGEKNRKALVELLKKADTPLAAKIAVVGALQWMFDADVQSALELNLKDGDPELQRVAAESLGLWTKKADADAQTALLQALSTTDLSVRRAVALAMGRHAGPGAADNLATALSFDETKDVYLRDGILRGLEMLGKPGMDALIALADSGVQKDTDRVVEAFLALRSREAFTALPTLLKHMHVSSSQRADLIRSAANYVLDPPVSLAPIVAFVVARPKEPTLVKKALLDVLAASGVAGARQVGKLYLDKTLPRSLRPEASAALRRYAAKDAEAAKLLAEVMKRD